MNMEPKDLKNLGQAEKITEAISKIIKKVEEKPKVDLVKLAKDLAQKRLRNKNKNK